MNSSVGGDNGYYRSFDGPALIPSANDTQLSPSERAAMEEEWRVDLARLESEIATLKSVLDTKVRQANELKSRLGMTPMAELKSGFQHSVESIRSSESYQKTNEKLHQLGETISSSEAYQKTNSAIRSFGSFASRKLGDIRNSNVFKSMEGKVGDAVTSVKV